MGSMEVWDNSLAIIGYEFLHRQSILSRSSVVVERQFFILPPLRLYCNLPIDIAQYIHRNAGQQFVPLLVILNVLFEHT